MSDTIQIPQRLPPNAIDPVKYPMHPDVAEWAKTPGSVSLFGETAYTSAVLKLHTSEIMEARQYSFVGNDRLENNASWVVFNLPVGVVMTLLEHPDKTFIGKITKGFDFLGYHFKCDDTGGTQLSLARQTIANFNDKLSRLREARSAVFGATGIAKNEQNRKRTATKEGCRALEAKIKTYINRFTGWAYGGLRYASDLVSGSAVVGCRLRLGCL